MKNIAIFASGEGTNAENIARYFAKSDTVKVATVLCNRPDAMVINRLKPLGIEVKLFDKEAWKNPTEILQLLKQLDVKLIVLAGFLAMVREPLLSAYSGRILNIHPSLLPKFGGKGMWGGNVHQAVIDAGEKESGITIHLVDANIDAGKIVAQKRCPVFPDDTADTLEARVHQLEYLYYPLVIEQELNKT
jgi:phosphoribosylglycinamide formyltransferase 1